MANNMDKTNDKSKEGGKSKNPIAFLKHLWKDPITTVAEANARKKETIPCLFGSIGLAVVSMILSFLIPALSFLAVFGIIGMLGAIAFCFILFVIKKAKEKFKALTCDKCNTMAELKTFEDFAKHVSYTVGKNEAFFAGVSHPSSNNGVVDYIDAEGRAAVVVAIDLKCPHCGNVKKLEYHIVPFKCTATQRKVAARDVEFVKTKLENAVRSVIADYNNPELHYSIPYSIHSVKNPLYEERGKMRAAKDPLAFPEYKGAKIRYRKDPEEMIEAFFVGNQLDGKIIDLSNSKK